MVNDYNEVKKLQVLPKLKAVVFLGKKINLSINKSYKNAYFYSNFFSETPLAENGDYRLEVLISVRRLERLDKDEYSEEERTEAENIYEERRQKEQEEAAQAQADKVNAQSIDIPDDKLEDDSESKALDDDQ